MLFCGLGRVSARRALAFRSVAALLVHYRNRPMSNRGELRKLSRKLPEPPALEAVLRALREEPDRSAAIVGAGLLETALEQLIIRSLTHSTPRLISDLFENRGP